MPMDCLPHILALALHSQGGFNTVVPGAGIFCRHGAGDAWIAGAGAYANSERAVQRRVSQYAFAGVQPWAIGPVPGLRIGGVVGLVNGYSYNSGRTLPMAALVASVPASALPAWAVLQPVKNVVQEFHVTVIPPVRGVTPAGWQLQAGGVRSVNASGSHCRWPSASIMQPSVSLKESPVTSANSMTSSRW